MYETKINIFTKGFKKIFIGTFFLYFSIFFCKICKKLIFKNGYTYKFDNVLIDSLILSKSVSEYHSFISLHKEKTSQTVHLDFYFLMLKKVLNLLKKIHGHNFASIHSTINQNESTHMPVMLIGCGNFRSIILGVAFFLTNYFKVKFSFFQKSKKNISTHFFYEKMVSVLFFFL